MSAFNEHTSQFKSRKLDYPLCLWAFVLPMTSENLIIVLTVVKSNDDDKGLKLFSDGFESHIIRNPMETSAGVT